MESSSNDEGGATISDASGDRDMVKKGPKKEVKAKAKDGEDKGKASSTKKRKKAAAAGEEDGEKKAKQPASVPKKPKKGGDSDDAMEVDSEPEKPMPKPKPKSKVGKRRRETRTSQQGISRRKREIDECATIYSSLLMELSLFQFTFHLVYSVAGLFTLLRMSFLLIQYHQTVRLASGFGKSSLIDRVSHVEEATGQQGSHVILYSEIGASLT